MQPMVLGSELLEIIRDILKLLKFAGSNRYFPLPLGIMQGGEGAGGPLSAQIPPIEQKLNKILSEHHFIEPNDAPK